MMNKQPPRWIPLEKLPLFSEAVEKMAHDTQEIGRLLAQAKNKPWVLDEATVHRANDLLTERLEILALYTEQLHRWKKEQLTPWQEKRIARLEKKTGNAVEEARQLLGLVNDIKENTLDQLLCLCLCLPGRGTGDTPTTGRQTNLSQKIYRKMDMDISVVAYYSSVD